jgi:hypothetical protein
VSLSGLPLVKMPASFRAMFVAGVEAERRILIYYFPDSSLGATNPRLWSRGSRAESRAAAVLDSELSTLGYFAAPPSSFGCGGAA